MGAALRKSRVCSSRLFLTQLEDALRLETGEQESLENRSLAKQNIELRRRLEEDQASYKRKLQAYQEGQQRQAQLVQKLQAKVGWAAAGKAPCVPPGASGSLACVCVCLCLLIARPFHASALSQSYFRFQFT